MLLVVDTPRVAAGGAHSLALSADGRTLWAWGDNGQGQLGLGDTASRGVPTVVAGLPTLQAIAAGADHSLALAADGSLLGWRENGTGMALGTTVQMRVPAPVGRDVDGFDSIVAVAGIAAGDGYSLAPDIGGRLWSWGRNGGGFALAVLADGSVQAWGANGAGQLGTASSEARRTEPVQVPGLNLN